jgi:hypothetical protein
LASSQRCTRAAPDEPGNVLESLLARTGA